MVLAGGCSKRSVDITAGSLEITLNSRGELTRLTDRATGQRYSPPGITSPLLSVRIDSVLHAPHSSRWDRGGSGLLTLRFPGDVTAGVRVVNRVTHVTFELASIAPLEAVELIVWGPYATTINGTIGETVGVVSDSVFAVGLQALNPKTLGGYPWNENDCMPQLDIFEGDDYTDLSEEGKRYVLYRVEAAKPEDFGSTLQAYTRNRTGERVIENWNHDRYVAPPFADGGIIGSKIALFGSPSSQALETIGEIEIAEGLPHPMIDGQWGKQSPGASAAYMIMNFGEEDINRALDYVRQAGLRYLYHSGPFTTWGHFELNDQFPNGRAGLRACVEKAEAAGIMVGVHTLSNFITTNDAWVTPVPDPRLAKVGRSTLTDPIAVNSTEIGIASPDFFNQDRNNNLRTVMIAEELIQYRTVSAEAPWRLLDCQRGAFGTRAAAHTSGETISKLADHAYNVFLTNAELGIEMATNIADFYNETGVRQISFDGLEGNRSTGMGNYGEILFTSTWYERLNPEIKQQYIADASRTSHYFWHIYTRMNWGEPWYAGFRESQTEYRLKNQAYFRRNLMPGMLGWFQMRPNTSIEDIEWMLARSAAFDAGYAFVTGYAALEANGYSDQILEAIGRWEQARMAGVFSDEQKRRMEDISAEFTLEDAEADSWLLTPIHTHIYRHDRPVRQPGEPRTSSFSFTNPGDEQVLHWIVTAEGGEISGVTMRLDIGAEVSLDLRLPEGWSIKYEGGGYATVRDANWVVRRQVTIDPVQWQVHTGDHTLVFDCVFAGEDDPKVRVELRTREPAERVVPDRVGR
ncbi:hypothetical protein ACFL44_01575 [Gemmatimonadota bacterium]